MVPLRNQYKWFSLKNEKKKKLIHEHFFKSNTIKGYKKKTLSVPPLHSKDLTVNHVTQTHTLFPHK